MTEATEPNAASDATTSSPQAAAPSNHATEPTAASHEAPAAAADPGTSHSSSTSADDGGDHDDGDDGPDDGAEGASGTSGEASVNADGTPGAPKKRRRRRRKSAAERAAARDARVAAGLNPDGTPIDPNAPPAAEGGEGGSATGATGEGGEGAAAGAAPAGGQREPRGDRKRGDRKDRGPRPERKEPHERPAFSHGDVVFGKVLAITDEALLIDLAGRGHGIFDRRELDIPDEPAQGPDAPTVDADDDELPPIPAARAEGEGINGSNGAAAASPAPDTTDAPVASADGAEKTEAAPDAEAGKARGRIVVAKALDPNQQPAADATDAALADTTESAALVDAHEAATAGAETDESALGENPMANDAGHDDEDDHGHAGAPTAAPVLPPVVLEVGANFVGVVQSDGGRGGLVVLTRHPRRGSKAKPRVATAFRDKTTVEGLVTGVIKGGVEVDVDGLRAFAPRSHVDLRPGADLHHLIGMRLPFEVAQYAKKGRDVVLSRKSLLEVEAKGKRAEALAKLPIGEIVEGTVRTVVTFGAFIDVGGVEGLVPLQEMSHNRSETPHQVFKVGEKVQVRILGVDERGKIWLSRRAASADPWEEVAKKYATGSKHKGKVVRLQPFGAFVELESGIDGLIHAADLSIKRIEHPSEVVNVGDEIDVIVSHVDPTAHRIALHPAPSGEAANEEPQRVQVQKQVKVVVVAVEVGGLTVRILGATGRHARGFINAAGTGTPRGTELRKLFPVGKELDAKVVEIDPKRSEVKLSIKALAEDNERSSYQQYRAQVKRESKFGTFGDLLAKKLGK
jgi:small subunit ribosomal protein S1